MKRAALQTRFAGMSRRDSTKLPVTDGEGFLEQRESAIVRSGRRYACR
jgi:hypothetical protein